MQIGYTVWTWGLESQENLETALKELKDIGYNKFENFIGMADMYEGRTDEFNLLVENYGFEFIALYHYIKDIDAENVESSRKYLEFCQKTGARIMNIQAPDRNGKPGEEHLLKLSDTLNKIGAMAREYDVTLCLHPHFQMTVEQADEIDFIAEHTDPELVKFCFDTAHTVLGGMDICQLLRKYKGRIGYIHLKDQDTGVSIDEYRKKWIEDFDGFQRFFELGTKNVNFPKVVETLRETGYDGYLVVENDTPTTGNYEGALISRNYIRENLNM